MRKEDDQAREILELLMEEGIRIPKKDYLHLECAIADKLVQEAEDDKVFHRNMTPGEWNKAMKTIKK